MSQLLVPFASPTFAHKEAMRTVSLAQVQYLLDCPEARRRGLNWSQIDLKRFNLYSNEDKLLEKKWEEAWQ